MLAALPGVREIRSALAGGYLWIVFIWLVLDPVLGESDFTSGPYESAHHLGSEVGPLALGLAITFVAYLIGTFFNEFRGVVARIYLRARSNVSSSSPMIQRIKVVDESERKKASERRRQRVEKLFAPLNRLMPEKRADSEKQSSSILLSVVNSMEDAVRLGFNLVVSPLTFLRYSLEVTFMIAEWIEMLFIRIARRFIGIRIEPYKPFLSKHGVTAVESYLAERKDSLPEVQPGVADVISGFPVVRVRLLHRSPDTVSEYDRLRAEAEFRSAIVPPLFMIIGLIAYKVSPWWLLAWPLLLILLATARARRREAGDILADTLGVVEAPCVESRSAEKHGGEVPMPTLDVADQLG